MPAATACCDCCGREVPREQIAIVIAYGIETAACSECRGEFDATTPFDTLAPPSCAAEADALIAAVARNPHVSRGFADALLAARVALREALAEDDITEARGWIETALRQLGE